MNGDQKELINFVASVMRHGMDDEVYVSLMRFKSASNADIGNEIDSLCNELIDWQGKLYLPM